MYRALIVGLVLLLAACSMGDASKVRLYVMDCGLLRLSDVSPFGLTNQDTPVRELFVPCYLIRHPKGNLLWDAGLDPALVGQGEVAGEGFTQIYHRSLEQQLAELGLQPHDIQQLAISHFHFDHAGSAGLFTQATLLIQRPEYEAAFLNVEGNPVYDYSLYQSLRGNPRKLLEGDHDVFGDGRVKIISAPGHTAGHQVLLLNLAKTGPLLVSGDLYHFKASRRLRSVPVFNQNTEATLASMDKVEALIAKTGATLWIEHDKALADTLSLSPHYYD